MNAQGITIIKLSAKGEDVPTALVRFQPGFNYVSGASNTGKTFVFQALNYMLGGSKAPKKIPEASRYTVLQLCIQDRAGNMYTLERPIKGGDAKLYRGVENDCYLNQPTLLASRAIKGRDDTISAFLLGLIGLKGKRVRTNQRGETRELSFRDLAHLNTIDEVRIYSEGSPILSGQYTWKTVEQSVLKLLITGEDDSGIVATEDRRVQRANQNAAILVVSELIDKHEREYRDLLSGYNSYETAGINHASRLLELREKFELTGKQLGSAQAKRSEMYGELISLESKGFHYAGLLERFDLLGKRYHSDIERLEAVSEASQLFQVLPMRECPVCHAKATHQHHHSQEEITNIKTGTRAEIERIRRLLIDLNSTSAATQQEQMALSLEIKRRQDSLSELDIMIEETLKPVTDGLLKELDDLSESRILFERLNWLSLEIQSLRDRLGQDVVSNSEASISPSPGLELALRGLASELGKVLSEWKFPGENMVGFDSAKFDFTLGPRDRDSYGKGMRALIYSAFSISTLRFCLNLSLPHPGFVILDSPLVAYREPDEAEEVPIGLKQAFFENLATVDPEEQIIVFENEDPPETFVPRINHVHFSGSNRVGRYGFFPIAE